jgi:uncharacterized protein (DUF1330 family)
MLVASLFIHPGREVEFHQFETAAARIMKRYGARIEHVIRPLATMQPTSAPYEIHIVSFPSMKRFEAYRADSDLAKLAPLRQSAVARTELVIGEAGEPYL